MASAVNKDVYEDVYSDPSIPEAATFFPMSAIVKPILEDRVERKASMPDSKIVNKAAPIVVNNMSLHVVLVTRKPTPPPFLFILVD